MFEKSVIEKLIKLKPSNCNLKVKSKAAGSVSLRSFRESLLFHKLMLNKKLRM